MPDTVISPENDPTAWLIPGGFLLGLAFGAIAQRSRFCLLAAVANLALMRDTRQVQAWVTALAVALAGAQALDAAGLVALSESGYRSGHLDWLGAVAGGAVFGFGAALAGGCAGRTLVNASEGNLGALAALAAFALAGWATLFGFLEPLRMRIASAAVLDLRAGDASIAVLLGLPALWLALGAALALAALVARLRPLSSMVLAGAAIGLLVVAGWWVTGRAAAEGFEVVRPDSITYSGPLARIAHLALGGTPAGGGFGVALVAGTMLGACVSALASGTFHLTRPAPGRLAWQLAGGLMMGVGGILAGGCNIGNGLTGASSLSLKAWLALVAIIAGTRLGVALLERGD
jgi:uncharacterized protein